MSFVLCTLYAHMHVLGSYNKGGGLYMCPLSFVLCSVQSLLTYLYILFMCVSSSFIHNVLLWLFDVYKFRLLQYSVLRIVYCVQFERLSYVLWYSMYYGYLMFIDIVYCIQFEGTPMHVLWYSMYYGYLMFIDIVYCIQFEGTPMHVYK